MQRSATRRGSSLGCCCGTLSSAVQHRLAAMRPHDLVVHIARAQSRPLHGPLSAARAGGTRRPWTSTCWTWAPSHTSRSPPRTASRPSCSGWRSCSAAWTQPQSSCCARGAGRSGRTRCCWSSAASPWTRRPRRTRGAWSMSWHGEAKPRGRAYSARCPLCWIPSANLPRCAPALP